MQLCGSTLQSTLCLFGLLEFLFLEFVCDLAERFQRDALDSFQLDIIGCAVQEFHLYAHGADVTNDLGRSSIDQYVRATLLNHPLEVLADLLVVALEALF